MTSKIRNPVGGDAKDSAARRRKPLPMAPIGYLETGVLHCGDNLERLAQLPSECVDLIYLDPPFFSNRHYEVIWGDEAEVRSFEDRWMGGIQHYVDWMRRRIDHLHRVLKPTGTIYLHCDPHASHYLKVMLDGIVGANNFRNEIIWHYSGWNKRLKNKFESRTDNILMYGKGPKQVFNSFAVPWASEEDYVKVRKQKVRLDDDGRKYVLSDAGGGKRVKRYLADAMAAGVYIDNVWNIDKLNNSSKERLGYPTQKPEALLERIITASSNKGDIVLDPFCGCGTTVAVAERMGRQWIGIDISPTATRLMKRRLERADASVRVYGLPETEDDLRALKPFEFQNWVISTLQGTHAARRSGDMGIDGYSFFERLPIQVKQSEKIGRNVIDNFETAVRRDGSHKGYVIAFSFGRGAYEEVARAKSEGLEIALVTVKTLLDNPIEEPISLDLEDMTRTLLLKAQEAVMRSVAAPSRLTKNIEELVASDQGVG